MLTTINKILILFYIWVILKFISQFMSYYDPLAPNVEATRFQIQRSISALEQKLRQRREIDMDIQHLRNQEFERRRQLEAYHHEINHRISYNDLPSQAFYAEDRYLAERSRYAMEEDEKSITHVHRMKQLELQQLQLSKEKLRSNAAFFGTNAYPVPDYPHFINPNNQYITYEEDDLALIRKYQDGTRAQQLKYELESYSNSRSGMKGSNQLHRNPLARPLASEFKSQADGVGRSKYSSGQKSALKPNQFTTNQQRSPYAKLDYDTTEKKGDPNLYIFNNEGIRSSPKQEPTRKQKNKQAETRGDWHREQKTKDFRNRQEKPKQNGDQIHDRNGIDKKKDYDKGQNQQRKDDLEREIFQPSSQRKRTGSKSFKNLNISRENHTNTSLINKAYKPKSGRKSVAKSPLKVSALERSRQGNLSIEESANLKIKNRLKCSQIIFQDSKFRNLKHEANHLHMTFENEVKIRKEIKDKINNHSVVLRKHAMVVE